LHTARTLGSDYDAAMDAYAYLLEQLRRDDCRRLREYTSDSRCKFSTWLVVVARRLCLDRQRQRYGRRQQDGPSSEAARAQRRRLVDLVTEELDLSSLPDPVDTDPEAQLRARELGHALSRALNSLAPRDRLLLTLRFEDGLSASKIGRIMGFATPFHVYRRLTSILDQLRAALTGVGVSDSEP
jgi:RNA polymerase sigma-70 factor (ECF subfamily)